MTQQVQLLSDEFCQLRSKPAQGPAPVLSGSCAAGSAPATGDGGSFRPRRPANAGNSDAQVQERDAFPRLYGTFDDSLYRESPLDVRDGPTTERPQVEPEVPAQPASNSS